MADYRKGDVGVSIPVRVMKDGAAWDISLATVKQLKIKSEKGPSKTFAAAFRTDGTDGIVEYVTTATSDLDKVGDWSRMAYLEIPGFAGHTAKGSFTVEEVL